jgi:hypothetical protein
MIAPPAKKPQINRGLARSICNRLLLPAWQPCKNTPHETIASFSEAAYDTCSATKREA